MQRNYCRIANWIWFHTRLNVHWVSNSGFYPAKDRDVRRREKRQEMLDAFLFQHLGRGAGDGCHLFSAGQQKGAPNTASCTRAAQHIGGQLPGRFKAFLSSACPVADALISLPCTSSASPTTAACVHMLHLPCLFFSPLFLNLSQKLDLYFLNSGLNQ